MALIEGIAVAGVWEGKKVADDELIAIPTGWSIRFYTTFFCIKAKVPTQYGLVIPNSQLLK